MQKINIRRPLNFSELTKDIQTYFPDSYIYEEQPVLTMKNCFVTFNGIVLSNLKYVRECFYKPFKYTRKYYPWAFKLYLLSFLTKWGRNHKLTLAGNTSYALIHQPYINYFHWMIESLTRFVLLENSKKKFTLIIPRNLLEKSYIKESLELLNIPNLLVVEDDTSLKVEHILLPSIVRWGACHHPDIILELRNRLLDGFKLKFGYDNKFTSERVFVLREKGRRKITNLSEVLEIAKKFECLPVDFEGLSVQEQISIMRNVKVFVAPHGAGLTNMLFMPPGGIIVEIHINPSENNYILDDSYYHLCSNLGHHYYVIISRKNDVNQDPFYADHVVPAAQLSKILKEVIKH